MSGRSLTRGGVASNVDTSVDPAKRAQILKDEHAAAIVDEAVKDAKKHGGDSFKMVTSEELASGSVQMDHTRHHDKTDRETGQEWVQPYGIVVGAEKPNGWGWSMSPALAEACEQGYKCPSCLQPIDPTKTVCTWINGRSSEILGCGYSFTLDQNIGWMAADKIRGTK